MMRSVRHGGIASKNTRGGGDADDKIPRVFEKIGGFGVSTNPWFVEAMLELLDSEINFLVHRAMRERA